MSRPPAPTPEAVLETLNAFYDDGGRKPFVLSLDGGGIYGLTTAIWLRQLCERAPGFLVPGQVRVFAGCSSGAINTLLMAMHESPREAVLAGELERFWTGLGVFSNENPLTRVLSGQGFTAMFGTEDFLGALHDEFGDMTLGEMKNRVVISTYNWTGATGDEQVFETPFDGPTPNLEALRPDRMLRLRPPGPNRHTRAGQTRMHWRPKFFDSHGLQGTDRDVKVVDVAYAAACVPGLRALRGGLGDGASFNANPAIGALAHMLREWELCVEYGLGQSERAKGSGDVHSPRDHIRTLLVAGLGQEVATDKNLADEQWVKDAGKGVLLSWMKMLSVGSGQALPALGWSNIDVGLNLWQQLPTNPLQGIFLPTNLFALDAPATAAEYVCKRLLDDDRSIRLNPDLMPIPTVMASMMALNPLMRSSINQMIRHQTESEKSRSAVAHTADFLNEHAAFGTEWYTNAEEPRATHREALERWREERRARTAARRRSEPWAAWTDWFRTWTGSGKDAEQPDRS